MKKFAFIYLFMSLFFANNIFSQKKVQFEFFAGYCPSWLSGDEKYVKDLNDAMKDAGIYLDSPMSKDPRLFQFNLGGGIIYNFANWLDLKAGVEYAPKGVEYNGKIVLPNSQYYEVYQLIQLAYIEFPISIQFLTRSKEEIEGLFFYFDVGASPAIKVTSKTYFGILLCEYDGNGSINYLDRHVEKKPIEGIKNYDFNAFFTIGAGWGPIQLDLKYEHGFNNITENSSGNLDLKNKMIALCLRFRF